MHLHIRLLLAAVFAAAASAHMKLDHPPDIRSKLNPNVGQNVDYDLTSPLSGAGQYPCKGNLALLGTPIASPVAEWAAGSQQYMTISGGADHNGGSCQASLSLDRGATFTVIHSWLGGCPKMGSADFAFRVPADTPASNAAIFSWTWFNNLGNRELYQGCAVVKITAGSGSEKVAFKGRPAPFIANLGNGCSTVEGGDVRIPNPGPDVEQSSSKLLDPVGSCEGARHAPVPRYVRGSPAATNSSGVIGGGSPSGDSSSVPTPGNNSSAPISGSNSTAKISGTSASGAVSLNVVAIMGAALFHNLGLGI